jgi:hypothetical protein|tara:strand:+ start:1081 stop:2823 length:1743 start_codon:yes stop_codon:yes gene_type:complete
MLTPDELLIKTDDLKGMHEHSGHYEYRDRVRSIMNGGSNGIAALLGNDAKNYDTDLPIPNLINSGLEHLAQKLGRMPDIKVDQYADSERAKGKAEKLERIVSSLDGNSKMDMQMPQAARWLPGYGFCVWIIRQKMSPDGIMYPHAELRDPYDCYPGYYGPDQDPKELALIRLVPTAVIKQMYPQAQVMVDESSQFPSGYSKFKYHDGFQRSWDNQLADGVELVEYYNEEGTYVFLPDTKQILDYTPNPLKSGPRFVISKRFSFDRLTGQYDHVLGLMAAMAKINVLSIIAMEDSVFTETNIIGELESGNYKRGRLSVNYLSPGSQVSKPPNNIPYQLFTQIDRIERQLRVGSSYPVSDDAISPNSFVTGRGLQELLSSVDLNVKEYQLSLKTAMEELDYKRLEMDEALNGQTKKPMAGYLKGTAYAEQYTPAADIKGMYKTRRIYGVMAGFDEPTKIVSGLQLLQAGIIDKETLQENMDGLDNVQKINDRILKDEAERTLFETLKIQASQGDEKATMALVQIYKNPNSMQSILDKFYTAEDPEIPEPEAALLGQDLGGGELAVPQGPAPDIRSLLLGGGQ